MTTTFPPLLHLGVQRFWKDWEEVVLFLTDTSGAPATGVGTGNISVSLIKPDGSTVNYLSTVPDSIPANTWNEVGNGAYRLRLWGSSGSVSGTVREEALDTVGTYGLHLRPNLSSVAPLFATYQVRPSYRASFHYAHLILSPGNHRYRSAVSIHRWWEHSRFVISSSDLESLTLQIIGRGGETYLSVDKDDATIQNQTMFFDEVFPAGIVAGDVLIQRLSFTIHGYEYTTDYPTVARN